MNSWDEFAVGLGQEFKSRCCVKDTVIGAS